MHLVNYFSLLVSPILTFVFILYLKFKFSIKSFRNIKNAFILGAVSVLLLLIANYIIELYWDGNYKNLKRIVFYVFIVVAFSSELGKFLPLRYIFFKQKNFKGPMEGIIYSIFISLGFSLITGILFLFEIIDSIDKFNHFTLFLFTMPIANIIFCHCHGIFYRNGCFKKKQFY